ncbi:MAG: flagellar motor protein MotB, partial [Kiloniellales bacterium]|nr:flagellar motor protein MotB [Kiloniellales bacterium]
MTGEQTDSQSEGLRATCQRMAPYSGIGRAKARKIWLTTFTDLTALMLTFFVLQFSMSTLDEVQWQNLTDSFQSRLEKVIEKEVPRPDASLSASVTDRVPGDDLAYLGSVITQYLQDADLTGVVLLNSEFDRIVLSVSLRGEIGTFAGKENEILEALATLFQRLQNRVDLQVTLFGESDKQSSEAGLRELAIARQIQMIMIDGGVGNLSTIRAYIAPSPSKTLDFSNDGQPEGKNESLIGS